MLIFVFPLGFRSRRRQGEPRGRIGRGWVRPAARVRSLARWIGLHHRNLAAIWVTHMHIDHYGGLSVLQRHFPDARAIATPKSV
jgi:glyoxylase-like metal-dependent hydrolase (beta-lactamase superfamily II)